MSVNGNDGSELFNRIMDEVIIGKNRTNDKGE
jgi:hypothetical protein